uniref:Electron transfer flavoprotein-ubiquinone oxidoreductase n=1 Tax=Aegilops tauschii subsp. strangulata TaxID=200361 RepID=A0A452YIV0_AEGTS
ADTDLSVCVLEKGAEVGAPLRTQNPVLAAALYTCDGIDDTLVIWAFVFYCSAGAHVLSGNVFEPRALDELIPKWRQEDVCPSVFCIRYVTFFCGSL